MRVPPASAPASPGAADWRLARRNFDYDAVHAEGAQRIAQIAAAAGVPRLVHVSHLNAAPDSPSAFYRSKARGEALVAAAFPAATIVRPGTMFGYEDKLLNNIARASSRAAAAAAAHAHASAFALAVWPIWWKLNDMQTKIRPVHVSVALCVHLPVLTVAHTLRLDDACR